MVALHGRTDIGLVGVTDFKKQAIPLASRQAVALRYCCPPGGEALARCYYCHNKGTIHWWLRRRDGKPGWVSFQDLELDHIIPEFHGGTADPWNIVLACRSCNRAKKDRTPEQWHAARGAA